MAFSRDFSARSTWSTTLKEVLTYTESKCGGHLSRKRQVALEAGQENTPVLADNRLVGFSHRKKGQFFCLDANTGKAFWESEGRMGENAATLNAGDLFF